MRHLIYIRTHTFTPGMRQVLEWLGKEVWKSEGVVVSQPDNWKVFEHGQGSYKFGRTMLFLAAGRLGQLQLLRNVEMSPFAAILQVFIYFKLGSNNV